MTFKTRGKFDPESANASGENFKIRRFGVPSASVNLFQKILTHGFGKIGKKEERVSLECDEREKREGERRKKGREKERRERELARPLFYVSVAK